MPLQVSIDQKKRTITIVMPLDEPRPSASGKTMVIATTRGNVDTGQVYNDQPVKIGVNAYYPATKE